MRVNGYRLIDVLLFVALGAVLGALLMLWLAIRAGVV